MGNRMRITLPKEFLTEDMENYLLWRQCERDGEDKNSVTFETFPHSIGFAFEVFGILTYERKKAFYRNISVRGGRKAFSRSEVVINPLLNKEVSIRVSREMYSFLKKRVKNSECGISESLRHYIHSELMAQHEPKTERERRGQEIASRCLAAVVRKDLL